MIWMASMVIGPLQLALGEDDVNKEDKLLADVLVT